MIRLRRRRASRRSTVDSGRQRRSGIADQPGQQGYHFPPEPEQQYDYGQQRATAACTLRRTIRTDGSSRLPAPAAVGPAARPARLRSRQLHAGGAQQPYPPADPVRSARARRSTPMAARSRAMPTRTPSTMTTSSPTRNEPRRGRRWMFVALAALVGAVGVGGALAYTYKSFVRSQRAGAAGAGDPNVKIRATERQAQRQDMLSRLGDDARQQNGPSRRTIGERRERRAQARDDDPHQSRRAGGRRQLSTPSARCRRRCRASCSSMARRAASAAAEGCASTAAAAGDDRRAACQHGAAAERSRQTRRRARRSGPLRSRRRSPSRRRRPGARACRLRPRTRAPATLRCCRRRRRAWMRSRSSPTCSRSIGELSGKVPDVQEADLSDGIGHHVSPRRRPAGLARLRPGVCSQLKTAGSRGCWVTEY